MPRIYLLDLRSSFYLVIKTCCFLILLIHWFLLLMAVDLSCFPWIFLPIFCNLILLVFNFYSFSWSWTSCLRHNILTCCSMDSNSKNWMNEGCFLLWVFSSNHLTCNAHSTVESELLPQRPQQSSWMYYRNYDTSIIQARLFGTNTHFFGFYKNNKIIKIIP